MLATCTPSRPGTKKTRIKHIAALCLRSVCACVCVCIMQRGEKLNCENSLEGMNYHLHSGNFRIGVSPASRVKTFVFIPATVAPLTETVEQCSNQSDLPGT